MSGAQTWTLIVGLLAVFAAVFGSMVGLVLRLVRAEIGVLGERIDGLRREQQARFDALERSVERLYEQGGLRREKAER